MSWNNLCIFFKNANTDQISDLLEKHGAISVTIQDKNLNTIDEEIIFGEPNNEPQKFWAECRIEALFNDSTDIQSIIKSLEENLKIKLDYQINQLEDQDWLRKSQQNFPPIKIADRLWIIPSWHEIVDKESINLILDPGMAFGTGSHPTTNLCLNWLIKNVEKHHTVLDYGCGSGILAITSKKLNATNVIAADIDYRALKASKENAIQNEVDIHIHNIKKNLKIEADLVVSNILASTLAVLAPALANYCKIGGKIALSGILIDQEEEIKQIYKKCFSFKKSMYKDGWVCINGIKIK